ncbi:hypothetical protein A2U01_0100204, partial [Trifolium medium]|nr:hypothetical protein [Trifolium medium]
QVSDSITPIASASAMAGLPSSLFVNATTKLPLSSRKHAATQKKFCSA